MNLLSSKISALFKEFPDVKKLFDQSGLPLATEEMTLEDFFSSLADQFFRDSGLTKDSILTLIENIIEESKNQNQPKLPLLKSLTICGGSDKSGKLERLNLTLKPGDVYGVTGLTGSGKTQFLEDIEYIALGDSPSGRKVLVNGETPSEEIRENLENHLCASLSQSMNFVMELSTQDFISMHIDCRKTGLSKNQKEKLIDDVLECANSLAGEKILKNTVITQLSGGQSRALMIADIALVSDAAVVLIDEPENAGIDKDKILKILSSKGKIVLVSTHDPVIALSCPKRILIKNGGVDSVIKRTKEEESLLEELKAFDSKLMNVRNAIREGKNVC